jgi:hypothetical protein
MKDKKTIESLSSAHIGDALPDAIERAIESYRVFMRQDNSDTPKMFGDHHNACKAAIAHIELLLKLARWVDLSNQADDQDRVNGLLKDAENELNKTREKG